MKNKIDAEVTSSENFLDNITSEKVFETGISTTIFSEFPHFNWSLPI